MKPKISIIVPGIRRDRWEQMYNSICQSTKYPFEIIIVGPYPTTSALESIKNIKLVKDFGCPVRCSNIGLALAEGELFTWNADDGLFLPGMLDEAIDAFESMSSHPKNVLLPKYMEGEPIVQPEYYYKLSYSYPKVKYIQDDWFIFNLAIAKTEYFRYLGGWDSQFETLAFSHADLAIRAQRDNCVIKVFNKAIVYNSHGHPDHTPVERGHVDHDDPLYRTIHNDEKYLSRITIDINNWMHAPSTWTRRFG